MAAELDSPARAAVRTGAPSSTSRAASAAAGAAIERLETQVGRIVRGKAEVIRLAVVCLLARGHMLIEDVPGVGKTTLARALARSLGLEFQRIQFTSDMLPSDIIGVSVYKRDPEQFEFQPGPIFANVVLADEINRASPKTQSALLEAMSERRVTVDGNSRALPDSFIVIATQNPLEYVGTFPLPESQLDRFMMSLQLGYPSRGEERKLLMAGGVMNELARIEPVIDEAELLLHQREASEVRVDEKLVEYILSLAHETRTAAPFLLGVSTRGVQSLHAATRAMALCEGRSFAIPDDVQRLAPAVLAHRVILRSGNSDLGSTREAIERVVAATPVPV